MKKRLLLLLPVVAFLLSATPGPDHKNFWCHYPPGQWTGVPGTASHVIILSIDISADGIGSMISGKVAYHLGHSPSLTGQTCMPATFNGTTASGCAEGVAATNDPAACPGGCNPATADILQSNGVGGFNVASTVALVPGAEGGPCVCPAGSPNAGVQPSSNSQLSVPSDPNGINCGASG